MATSLHYYNNTTDTDTDTTGTDPESECGEYDTMEFCDKDDAVPSGTPSWGLPGGRTLPSSSKNHINNNNQTSSNLKNESSTQQLLESAANTNGSIDDTDIFDKLLQIDLDRGGSGQEDEPKQRVEEEDVFQNLINLIKEQIEQIEQNSQKVVVQDFDRGQHWQRLALCVKNVSKECTKLSLSYTKPPYPTVEEGRYLVRDVAKAIDIMLAWGLSLPQSEGKTVKKLLDNYLQYLLQACQEFLIIMQSGADGKDKDKLIKTSMLWERCDKFQSLPTTNKDALLQRLESQLQLVVDGMKELQQLIEESKERQSSENKCEEDEDEFEEDEEWTEDEMKLMKPVNGIIMVAKGYLKKVLTTLKSNTQTDLQSTQNQQLDEIYAAVEAISSSVDELVMAAYPPIEFDNLAAKMVTVEETLKLALKETRSCYLKSAETDKWCEFLGKAIIHNMDNFRQLQRSTADN